MNYVQIIAAFFVWRWIAFQVLGALGFLALVILAAVGGDPWPLIAVGLLFLVCWAFAIPGVALGVRV